MTMSKEYRKMKGILVRDYGRRRGSQIFWEHRNNNSILHSTVINPTNNIGFRATESLRRKK